MTSDQPEGSQHIHPLQTFQDGRVPSIKGNFVPKRLSMQVGPQRPLFLCSIEQTVKEICTFREWEGSLSEFLLRFGLCPAPRLSTKLMKMPVSILRKLYIRIIVYLDDFILGKISEEAILGRDTVIYLLQNLGFVIHLK